MRGLNEYEEKLMFYVGETEKGTGIYTDMSDNSSMIILGNSGTGKTTKLNSMINNLSTRNSEKSLDVIILDSSGRTYGNIFIENECVSTYVNNYEGYLFTIAEALEEIERRKIFLNDNNYRSWEHYIKEDGSFKWDILNARQLLVIDNVISWNLELNDNLTSKEYEKYENDLEKIFTDGRAFGIRVITITQSDRYIPEFILNNSSVKLLFDNGTVGEFVYSDSNFNDLKIKRVCN